MDKPEVTNSKPANGGDDKCTICHDEDLPSTSRATAVAWVDCDVCSMWAHTYCAKKQWKNVRKNSWLCDVHTV